MDLFQSFHDPRDEPVSSPFLDFQWEEHESIVGSKSKMKQMIFSELDDGEKNSKIQKFRNDSSHLEHCKIDNLIKSRLTASIQ